VALFIYKSVRHLIEYIELKKYTIYKTIKLPPLFIMSIFYTMIDNK